MSGIVGGGRSEAYVCIYGQLASGVNEGSFASGAWRTRLLNIKYYDSGNIATLAANRITLLPGSYRVKARCPVGNQVGLSNKPGGHLARLINVTDVVPLLYGSAGYASLDNTGTQQTQDYSVMAGEFTIVAGKQIELQHLCASSVTDTAGFGNAAGLGANEIYSIIEFWRKF